MNKNESKPYYKHLNGLKGMACMLIMLLHYLNLYQELKPRPHSFPPLDIIIASRYSFLLRASFWLYLFFVISGYLLARSDIRSIKELFVKSVSRFLRLALPILFASLIIGVLYSIWGFKTEAIQERINNPWLGSFYKQEFSFLDFLKAPVDVLIRGNSGVNQPYWVLRDMMFASVFIYVLSYIKNKTETVPVLFPVVTLIALFASQHCSETIAVCLFGAVISWNEERIRHAPPVVSITAGTLLMLPAAAGYTLMFKVLFFSALVLYMPLLPRVNAVFSSKPMQYLGDISFGIYSCHWPVFCSIGLSVFLRFPVTAPLILPAAACCLFSVLITLVLAYLFHISFERLSGIVIKALTGRMLRPLFRKGDFSHDR